MSNLQKYEEAFIKTFGVSQDQLAGLKYQGIISWDSVGHMSLVAALEATFDIMFDTEDIIAISSFEQGKVILKKYNVFI